MRAGNISAHLCALQTNALVSCHSLRPRRCTKQLLQCAAAIIFAVFPVSWKHGSSWQVLSCSGAGVEERVANDQVPEERQSSKLQNLNSLGAAILQNQGKQRDEGPQPYNGPWFWSTLQLTMATGRTVCLLMLPVITVKCVAEMVPAESKLLQ